jgi:hypothetical protein
MYGYQPIVPRDINDLLELGYSQEGIFKIVFGYLPMSGTYVISPFRTDQSPGCWFEWYDDKLYFKDFGEVRGKRQRDCFQAVKDFYSLPTLEATINFIVKYYNDQQIELTPTNIRHSPHIVKTESSIDFRAKPFKDSDRLFWSQYQIKKAHLIEDNVFSALTYKIYSGIKKTTTIIRPNDLCYVITGFEDRCKVYRPKQKGKGKFITTCTQNDVGGYTSLPFVDKLLLITKSYKDWRVLKNQGYNVIWFQNEGMFPSDEILYDLSIRFEHILILFDNDQTGIKAAQTLIEVFKQFDKTVNFFYSPYSYLKDPAEIISVKGKEELNQFLWNNCQV